MTHSIVFLDRGTIGPGVTVRRPDFPHDWREHDTTSADQVAERIGAADIVITNKVPIDRGTLEACPELRCIAVAATGYNVIDIEACRERGIAVTNIREYATSTVPEHTFALMLALRRNLFEYRQQVLDGEWERSGQFCFFNRPIFDLSGATLGVVGAGALGQAVGRLGAAFGMSVLYHDDYAKAAPSGGTLAGLDTLRQRADVITLHCPLTDETRGMIDRAFLQGMKDTALVINTARGGIIVEQDLADAIEAGEIGGAAIDVTEIEPATADNPILRIADRYDVLLTPHVAWASVGAMQTLSDQLIDNIEAFVDGREANRVV